MNGKEAEHLFEAKTIAFELANPLLNEMANVYFDRKANISIQINCSEYHNVNYFKLYNHQSYKKASKVARISLFEPKYIIHENKDGKENWILNAKQRKALVEILKLPAAYKDYSIWQLIILAFNKENGLNSFETEENFKNDLKYPDYLPIDMTMPDYIELR